MDKTGVITMNLFEPFFASMSIPKPISIKKIKFDGDSIGEPFSPRNSPNSGRDKIDGVCLVKVVAPVVIGHPVAAATTNVDRVSSDH